MSKDAGECLRFNTGKPLLSLNNLGVEANNGEAVVWEYGLLKYSMGNWLKGQKYTKSVDSLLRHIQEFLAGNDYDLDPKTYKAENGHSGLAHVFHIMCCAKILAQSWSTRVDLDDRSKPTSHRAYRFDMASWATQDVSKISIEVVNPP